MPELTVVTRSRCELVDISGMVARLVPARLNCGICHLHSLHTTAALTVNENADPDVKRDILEKLDALIPHCESFYRHAEGNSDAHLKSSLMGFSLSIPVRGGRLRLGTWQGIYLCEFDGPRPRRIEVCFQEAFE
ncbi:MAG: YjbQ family protein [Lentisphaeria bacterium]|nr:YjbQ family protein [Lentisphaeria bacterium]